MFFIKIFHGKSYIDFKTIKALVTFKRLLFVISGYKGREKNDL